MKFLVSLSFVILSFSLSAQNEQAFGDSLFINFSGDSVVWEDWYITLETYHKLIERQRFDKQVQDDFMLSINENYNDQLSNFSQTMTDMQNQYNVEDDTDSYYKLTKVETEPLKDAKLIYFFRLYITYYWKKGEDNYVIEFQACYLNKQWHMMEPFQEYYE